MTHTSSKMDWEKKFNSIIRDTDANLEKVKPTSQQTPQLWPLEVDGVALHYAEVPEGPRVVEQQPMRRGQLQRQQDQQGQREQQQLDQGQHQQEQLRPSMQQQGERVQQHRPSGQPRQLERLEGASAWPSPYPPQSGQYPDPSPWAENPGGSSIVSESRPVVGTYERQYATAPPARGESRTAQMSLDLYPSGETTQRSSQAAANVSGYWKSTTSPSSSSRNMYQLTSDNLWIQIPPQTPYDSVQTSSQNLLKTFSPNHSQYAASNPWQPIPQLRTEPRTSTTDLWDATSRLLSVKPCTLPCCSRPAQSTNSKPQSSDSSGSKRPSLGDAAEGGGVGGFRSEESENVATSSVTTTTSDRPPCCKEFVPPQLDDGDAISCGCGDDSTTKNSRVLLTQRPSSSTPVKMSGSPSSPVGQAAPHAPSGIPPNIPGLAELFATVQKHTFELRQLAVQQRRHELENEYVKAELVRLRRDVKKLASGSSSSSSSSRSSAEPTPRPASTSAPRPSSSSASGPPPTTVSTLPTPGPTALLSPSQRPAPVNFSAEISEEILRRMTRLEEKVTEMQEQRLKEKMTPRSLLLGTSPLACVDDHFLVEADDVTPTQNGQLAEPLGFNLDDLALSDSDDH